MTGMRAHSDEFGRPAVAAAYGWPADISEKDGLARLFQLNQVRAGAVAGLFQNVDA
jgi:hypothetical protein